MTLVVAQAYALKITCSIDEEQRNADEAALSVLNSSVPSLPPQAVHTALGLHRLAHCLRYCGLNQPCDWDSFT